MYLKQNSLVKTVIIAADHTSRCQEGTLRRLMTRDAAEHKSWIPVWPFAPSSHLHRFLCVHTVAAQTVGPWLSCKNNTIIYTCYSWGLLYPCCTSMICSSYLSATLYFNPSFSISAITQSVIHGIPTMDAIQVKCFAISVLSHIM